MSSESFQIIVNGSRDVIEAIHESIVANTGNNARMIERKNLDGDTATWIVIATLANQALPPIFNFIKDLLANKKVSKIKIGDIEIENPTPEMISEFEQRLKNRSNEPEV